MVAILYTNENVVIRNLIVFLGYQKNHQGFHFYTMSGESKSFLSKKMITDINRKEKKNQSPKTNQPR